MHNAGGANPNQSMYYQQPQQGAMSAYGSISEQQQQQRQQSMMGMMGSQAAASNIPSNPQQQQLYAATSIQHNIAAAAAAQRTYPTPQSLQQNEMGVMRSRAAAAAAPMYPSPTMQTSYQQQNEPQPQQSQTMVVTSQQQQCTPQQQQQQQQYQSQPQYQPQAQPQLQLQPQPQQQQASHLPTTSHQQQQLTNQQRVTEPKKEETKTVRPLNPPPYSANVLNNLSRYSVWSLSMIGRELVQELILRTQLLMNLLLKLTDRRYQQQAAGDPEQLLDYCQMILTRIIEIRLRIDRVPRPQHISEDDFIKLMSDPSTPLKTSEQKKRQQIFESQRHKLVKLNSALKSFEWMCSVSDPRLLKKPEKL